MPVPKTSVHEDASAVFLQHDVGSTRKFLHIDTETITMCEKVFPHDNLRLRIPALDTCHAPVPLFGSHFVCHDTNVQRITHFPKISKLFRNCSISSLSPIQRHFVSIPSSYSPTSTLTNLYRFPYLVCTRSNPRCDQRISVFPDSFENSLAKAFKCPRFSLSLSKDLRRYTLVKKALHPDEERS